MKQVQIKKCTEKEQQSHENLIKSFIMIFSSFDVYNFGLFLHDEGMFFERMNKKKVESYFFSLFFNPKKLSSYYNFDVSRAVSIDHLPGEAVLIFRYYPIGSEQLQNLGFEKKEMVITLSFSFKDELIYTIRVPKRYETDIREFEKLN